jgi:hypothetical protein
MGFVAGDFYGWIGFLDQEFGGFIRGDPGCDVVVAELVLEGF